MTDSVSMSWTLEGQVSPGTMIITNINSTLGSTSPVPTLTTTERNYFYKNLSSPNDPCEYRMMKIPIKEGEIHILKDLRNIDDEGEGKTFNYLPNVLQYFPYIVSPREAQTHE